MEVETDPNKLLEIHLRAAERHLYHATVIVYAKKGAIRGLFYRLRLLGAHDRVFKLHAKELTRKRSYSDTGKG